MNENIPVNDAYGAVPEPFIPMNSHGQLIGSPDGSDSSLSNSVLQTGNLLSPKPGTKYAAQYL